MYTVNCQSQVSAKSYVTPIREKAETIGELQNKLQSGAHDLSARRTNGIEVRDSDGNSVGRFVVNEELVPYGDIPGNEIKYSLAFQAS